MKTRVPSAQSKRASVVGEAKRKDGFFDSLFVDFGFYDVWRVGRVFSVYFGAESDDAVGFLVEEFAGFGGGASEDVLLFLEGQGSAVFGVSREFVFEEEAVHDQVAYVSIAKNQTGEEIFTKIPKI